MVDNSKESRHSTVLCAPVWNLPNLNRGTIGGSVSRRRSGCSDVHTSILRLSERIPCYCRGRLWSVQGLGDRRLAALRTMVVYQSDVWKRTVDALARGRVPRMLKLADHCFLTASSLLKNKETCFLDSICSALYPPYVLASTLKLLNSSLLSRKISQDGFSRRPCQHPLASSKTAAGQRV